MQFIELLVWVLCTVFANIIVHVYNHRRIFVNIYIFGTAQYRIQQVCIFRY